MEYTDFIPPFSDFGFKNLFGKEGKAKKNLIVLLNAILHEQLGFEQIIDLRFHPTENKAENPGLKTTHYDIHCITRQGHRIIVEMQNRWMPNFPNRMLYYVSEAIERQGSRKTEGEVWDYTLDPVIGIAFCNFVLPGFENEPIVFFDLRERKTNKPYGEQIGIAYIHLPEFTESEQECVTELQMIIYSLKNMEEIQRMERIPFSREKDDFYERVQLMSRVSALSESERRDYDRWLKQENDRRLNEIYLVERTAKENLEKGRAEGRAEGEWESAKNFYKLGVDIATISKATGISEEELKRRLEPR